MQIWAADLERSTGKCRAGPSISDGLRRHLCIFSLVPMVIPDFGTRLPSSGIFSSQGLNIRRERREGRERRGRERGGDALLRHSITNPFKNASRKDLRPGH